jgi:hypothetical protein
MQYSLNPDYNIVNLDRESAVVFIADELSMIQLQDCVKAINKTKLAIEGYANIRLAMEVLMLDLPRLEGRRKPAGKPAG